MSDTLEAVVGFIDHLSRQDLAWELKKLHAIREWALSQAGIDYQVGDTVEIVDFTPSKNGWWAHREALHEGATATVRKIDFSPHSKCWGADIILDREWSVSDNWPRPGEQTRYWHGPIDATPEGYEPPSKFDQEKYPDGRRHTFMFRADQLRKVRDAGN